MFIIVLPFIRKVNQKAELERNKSIQKNPNKVHGNDVVSSVRVVTFVKYLPFIGIVWVNLCYFFVNYYLYSITKTKYHLFNMIIVGVISFMFY